METNSFLSSFFQSLFIIIFSELGDKTFFISALLSMKYGIWKVFMGSMLALLLMTILSALVGISFTNFLSKKLTESFSIFLFLFFGFRLLYESVKLFKNKNHENMELKEAEEEILKKKNDEENDNEEKSINLEMNCYYKNEDEEKGKEKQKQKEKGNDNLEICKNNDCIENFDKNESNEKINNSLRQKKSAISRFFKKFASPAFVQAFSLTFVGEWGDRSQISTIVLSASKNTMGVTLGALLGHFFCTLLAVFGGKVLATTISEQLVCIIAGILFLIFAVLGYINMS